MSARREAGTSLFCELKLAIVDERFDYAGEEGELEPTDETAAILDERYQQFLEDPDEGMTPMALV